MPTPRRLSVIALPIALLLLWAVTAGCSGNSRITATIQAGSASAAVGAEAQAPVQALAVAAPGLGAWTINIDYDPAVVSITTCESPPPSACNTHKDDHTVRLAGASAPGEQGDVTLMTMTFLCKAAGTSALKVTVELLADGTIGKPRSITPHAKDGSITCT